MCERGQGQALTSISASQGVIISHPGVTGAKTVIWTEGSGRKKPGGGCCTRVVRAIRRLWSKRALKLCPGNRARISPGIE